MKTHHRIRLNFISNHNRKGFRILNFADFFHEFHEKKKNDKDDKEKSFHII